VEWDSQQCIRSYDNEEPIIDCCIKVMIEEFERYPLSIVTVYYLKKNRQCIATSLCWYGEPAFPGPLLLSRRDCIFQCEDQWVISTAGDIATLRN
jgi:hypothetical protein